MWILEFENVARWIAVIGPFQPSSRDCFPNSHGREHADAASAETAPPYQLLERGTLQFSASGTAILNRFHVSSSLDID